MRRDVRDNPREILVVVPNWVGDVVLATPVLAALRSRFADARICYLMRAYVREVVAGAGWHDDEMIWASSKGLTRERANWKLARSARGRFDLVLLLTNSFRSGLFAWLTGAPRRVGYARDGRRWLLTDRLEPLRKDGRFVPAPVLDYYVALAERVGCPVADRKLRLPITPTDEQGATSLRAAHGVPEDLRYAVINPGAAYGAAKCWLPERFASVIDRLADEHDLRSVIVGSPGERALMRVIAEQSRAEPFCLADPGTSLGTLKPIMRDASLLVCNDTGPRHYGNAFDIPTVTIFGPTHQAWTDTGYAGEIKLQVEVDCGPCQLKKCPLDHRCMGDLSVEMVMDAVGRSLRGDQALPVQGEVAGAR